MPLTPQHDGQLRIECDLCGKWQDTDLEDAGPAEIADWLWLTGWKSCVGDDGDHEYFCPECAAERTNTNAR